MVSRFLFPGSPVQLERRCRVLRTQWRSWSLTSSGKPDVAPSAIPSEVCHATAASTLAAHVSAANCCA
eukprot:1020051-Pyramimonas_sp.AAC.1